MVIVHLQVSGRKDAKPATFNQKKVKSLKSTVDKIFKYFKLPEDQKMLFQLRYKSKHLLVNSEQELSSLSDTDELVLINVEEEIESCLEEIREAIPVLQMGEENVEIVNSVTDLMKNMGNNLNLEIYASELIRLNGLQALLLLMLNSSTELQDYSILTLNIILNYTQAITYISNNPNFVQNLYEILYSKNEYTQLISLQMLTHLCQNSNTGFTALNKSAKYAATIHLESVFGVLVGLLEHSKEGDLQLQTLYLVRMMLLKAPNDKQFTKILARLRNLGMFEVIQKYVAQDEKEMRDICKELYILAGIVFSTSEFERDIYKTRVVEMERQVGILEKKIEKYDMQQNLYEFLKEDLRMYKQLLRISQEKHTQYYTFSTLNEYAPEFLDKLPQLADNVTDLKSILEEGYYTPIKFKDEIDKMSEEKREVEVKYKESLHINEKLMQQVEKLEGQKKEETTYYKHLIEENKTKYANAAEEKKRQKIEIKELHKELATAKMGGGKVEGEQKILKLREENLALKKETQSLKSRLLEEQKQFMEMIQTQMKSGGGMPGSSGIVPPGMGGIGNISNQRSKEIGVQRRPECMNVWATAGDVPCAGSEKTATRSNPPPLPPHISNKPPPPPIPPTPIPTPIPTSTSIPTLTGDNKGEVVGAPVPTPPIIPPPPITTGIPPPRPTGIPLPPRPTGIPLPPRPTGIPLPPRPGGIPLPPGPGGIPLPPRPGGIPLPPRPGGIPPPIFKPSGPQPTRPKLTLATKVKVLHWVRFILWPRTHPEHKYSIWSDINMEEIPQNEIEEIFEAKPTKTLPLPPGERTSIGRLAKKKVLTTQRTQNVAVVLNRLPNISRFKEMIYNMDSKGIPKDQISALIKVWLTAEEKQQLREEMAAEPDAIWDKQEDYFISLIGIPQIDNRLLIWEIRLDFPLQYTYFKEFTTIFQEGFKCLLNSQLLKQIFALILATGNIMNGGTGRGQADGFKLEGLAQLWIIKGKDSKTPLEYICSKLIRHRENTNQLANDLNEEFLPLFKAKRLDLKEIQAQFATFKVNYHKMKQKSETVIEQLAGTGDNFEKIHQEYLTSSNAQMELMENMFSEVRERYSKTVDYFLIKNSDEAADSTEKLFSIFTELIERIKRYISVEQEKGKSVGRRVGGTVQLGRGVPGIQRTSSTSVGPMIDPAAALANIYSTKIIIQHVYDGYLKDFQLHINQLFQTGMEKINEIVPYLLFILIIIYIYIYIPQIRYLIQPYVSFLTLSRRTV